MGPLTNWARNFFARLAPTLLPWAFRPMAAILMLVAARCIWKVCNGASWKREPGSAWPSMATRTARSSFAKPEKS